MIENCAKKKARILIVDDCHDSADGIGWILASYGYEVDIAYDGSAAIAKARTLHPDIVLLDLGLPEMDGYQVAGALKNGIDGTPVLVAVTGYGRECDKAQSAAAGFQLHLTKPVDPATLLQTLESV